MAVSAIRRRQLNGEMFQLRLATGEQVLDHPAVHGRGKLLKKVSSISHYQILENTHLQCRDSGRTDVREHCAPRSEWVLFSWLESNIVTGEAVKALQRRNKSCEARLAVKYDG